MLRFQLFGFPVRVQWTFWLTTVLLSGGLMDRSPDAPLWILAFVIAAFVSILWHELGHAFAFRRFRGYPEIVLYHFGGYAQSSGSLSRREDIIVSAAGPMFQLVVWAVLVAGLGYYQMKFGEGIDWARLSSNPNALHLALLPFDSTSPDGKFLNYLLLSLLYINFFWALLNLVPVRPLDGSRILEAKLTNRRQALMIGAWCGFAVAALGFLSGRMFLGIMFGMLAYQSLMLSRGQHAAFPWER